MTSASVAAVVSVVELSVVVVSLSVVVDSFRSSPSLLEEQEMMLRLKQKIRKMNKTFFIFSSIPKVKHYCLFNKNVKYNINRFVIQCEGYFTLWVSDCEELVGVILRG